MLHARDRWAWNVETGVLESLTVSRKHSMTNRGAERGSLPGNISQVVCSWSYVVAFQIKVFILDVS